MVAALAYALAGFALYQLVVPVLHREPEPAAGVGAPAAAPRGQVQLPTAPPDELLALRAVSSRVQQSVYAVRVGGVTQGSGFVAWTSQGRVSFLLTARTAVAGRGAAELLVKQARTLWPARVVASDPATGLALLRVNALLDRPLWQQSDNRAPLRDDAHVVVVPSGKAGSFADGQLRKGSGALSLQAVKGSRYLGAPVVDDDGRLAGVAVELRASGAIRIVPLSKACSRIRAAC